MHEPGLQTSAQPEQSVHDVILKLLDADAGLDAAVKNEE
jgi:hypothetical protein